MEYFSILPRFFQSTRNLWIF